MPLNPLSLTWTLLDSPGLSLRNSLNKCWFHSTLHLLTNIPSLRASCSSKNVGHFEKSFLAALSAIFSTRQANVVNSFFHLVKDFSGVNNRYGQVAVPDFIEYLCSKSPILSSVTKFTFLSKLTCSNCKWISERKCNDYSLKLHLDGKAHVSLIDLVNLNSNAVLSGVDAVFCGHCKVKTSQKQARDYDNPDLLMLEIVRVTKLKNNWIKNSAPLSFDSKNLQLPGFLRPYRVVGSCHHRGSLEGGHWITKILTKRGWFEMDDLQRKCRKISSPGVNDESVSILLLIAEDKFRI